MKTNNTGIYEILNTDNGKRYIGSAVNFIQRWNNHRSDLRQNKHHNRHLQSAWNKHGETIFKFSPILVCEKSMLLFYEQCIINGYKPKYNISPTAGSRLGIPCTVEAKIKIGDANRGKKKPPRSPEHRANLSASHCGKKRSPEAIEKSAAPQRGKKLSPEHCAKIAKANRGKKRSPEHCMNLSIALTGKKYAPPSLETKVKLSLAIRGIKRGSMALEHKTKLAVAHLGKKHSPETKIKMAIAQQARRAREALQCK